MTIPGDDNWFTCPNCGAVVPNDAVACPECGSDDETGWSDDAQYLGYDLMDPDLATGYGEEEPPIRTKAGLRNVMAVVFIILMILLILYGFV